MILMNSGSENTAIASFQSDLHRLVKWNRFLMSPIEDLITLKLTVTAKGKIYSPILLTRLILPFSTVPGSIPVASNS